jgi:cation diffusion facilitator family transporter
MGNLLIKLFIKNYNDIENPDVRLRYGKLAGGVGIATNLVLCVMKVIVGLISGSIAIIADGINNLSDTSSSLITLIGFRLSSQPEDESHPYGHARMEYLAGLIVSVLIIVVGVFLMQSSIDKIINPVDIVVDNVTLSVLAISMLVKLWQTFFNRKIGKTINSVTLIATATDSRNDVLTTGVILIGVAIVRFTGIQLDGWLGCFVALFIIWSGVQLIRQTSSPLLGEAPDQHLIDEIVRITHSNPNVLGIHDLAVHNYGPGKVFASIHIEVDADGDLMQSHDMVDNIEYEIRRVLNIHCVAHMDPVRVNDPIVCQVREPILKLVESLDDVTEVHDLRVVPGHTHTNIIFDAVLATKCTLSEQELQKKFEDAIHQINPTYHVSIVFDRAYTRL